MITEDVKCSDKNINLMTALSLLHKKNLKVIKEGKNPHFNSNHATLPGVLEALHEPLQEAGLVVVQMPLGGIDTCLLMTKVIHAASGEYIQWIYASPVSKKDPQGFGSALTYAKRYTLVAFFGLPEKDDDGNEASQRKDAIQHISEDPGEEVFTATNSQRTKLAVVATELGASPSISLKKLEEYLMGVPLMQVRAKVKAYIDKHK